MSEVKFKVGDLVYCPDIDNAVHTLESYDKHLAIYYNLRDNCDVFYFDGTSRKSYAPRIFHATQENYELLSKLYPNVEFEPPPKRKEPKEIIKAMLDYGYHGVLCQIAMADEDDASIVYCYRYDYALDILDDKIIFSNHAMYNDELDSVTPFHQKSGMEIVDFVNGKIVLQNGEVVVED